MKTFTYTVRRGIETGMKLYPHRYRDGKFRVSMTRFEKDQIALASEDELIRHIREGYGVRMSNSKTLNHRAPSLIHPEQIQITDR